MPSIATPASLVAVPDEEGFLAYDLTAGRLYRLNPTAALIVELLRQPLPVDDLQPELVPVLGAEGWRACSAWIADAKDRGLLVVGAVPGQALDAQALTEKAARLRQQDRVLAAYVCQRRASEMAPEDADVWYGLGELAHIVGRRAVARDAYGRYAAVHPDDAEVAHLLVSLRDEMPPSRVPDRAIHQLYSRFSAFYDENMEGDLGYRAPAVIAGAVERAIGSRRDLRVLDLGCGSGLSGQPLRRVASALAGVDLSPQMIARARARGVYDELHVAEITAFLATAPALPFDLVVACDALIYFGDLGQVLGPAAAWLAPGGVLAFTVERSVEGPYRLTDSGRFAHHVDHVADAARQAGLGLDAIEEAELRWEYGEPVIGMVAVCRPSRWGGR